MRSLTQCFVTVMRLTVDANLRSSFAGGFELSVVDVDVVGGCAGNACSRDCAQAHSSAAEDGDSIFCGYAPASYGVKADGERFDQAQLFKAQIAAHDFCRRNGEDRKS